MHTIKPLDVGAILAAAAETQAVVTIEEHGVIGGLGGAVAEVLAEADLPRVAFRRIGLPAAYSKEVGGCEYLRRIHGLDESGVLATLRGLLAGSDRAGAVRTTAPTRPPARGCREEAGRPLLRRSGPVREHGDHRAGIAPPSVGGQPAPAERRVGG